MQSRDVIHFDVNICRIKYVPDLNNARSVLDAKLKRNYVELTLYCPAMPFGNRKKNILEDLFSSVLSNLKNITPLET